VIAVRPGHEHRSLESANNRSCGLARRPHDVNGSFPLTLFDNTLQPRLVGIEELDDRVPHPLWEGLVLGREHAAQAHPLVAQDVQVQVGVGFELGRRVDRVRVEGCEGLGEAVRVPTDERLPQLGFAREVIMQRGFGELQLGGHVCVAEAIEATALGEVLGRIKNLGRGIHVPMPTRASHGSARTLTAYLLVSKLRKSHDGWGSRAVTNGQLYVRAMAATLRIVEHVSPERWQAPTPCTEWNARQVANHIIGENLWAGELFQGKTVAEVGTTLDGDLTGDDPASAYRRSVEVARKVVETAGAMQATCHLSFGDYSGADYAGQLFMDILIHGWDIAKGTGQDSRLDADLVAHCLPIADAVTRQFRAAGVFGDDLSITGDVDQQTQLLALVGRRP
jgi:uncharacterized protein (TIGR03086 family)